MRTVLVVDDDPHSAELVAHVLRCGGYAPSLVDNGQGALAKLERLGPVPVVTDWMMPGLSGVDLVREVRSIHGLEAPIIVVSAMSNSSAREHMLSMGADDYVRKPFRPNELLDVLGRCVNVRGKGGEVPARRLQMPVHDGARWPTVCIAASTGAPPVLRQLVAEWGALDADVLIVLHGTDWLLEEFAGSLRRFTDHPIRLVRSVEPLRGRGIYLASGDAHMATPTHALVCPDESPPVEFARPAADVLFVSAARAFSRKCIGVVLSGIGSDGAAGSAHIADAGGVVLIQDPETAVASGMPRAALNTQCTSEVLSPTDLAKAVLYRAQQLHASSRTAD